MPVTKVVKQYADRAPDLYLQTCAELKKEIAESVNEERMLERNSLLACAAVYTYLSSDKLLASDKTHAFPPIAWYVPCAIALFGAYRTAMLMISITPRAQFLKRVERMILPEKALEGWEDYFRVHYRFGVGASIWAFWIGLIACTLIAPDYFITRAPPRFVQLMWDVIKSEPIRIPLVAAATGVVTVALLQGTRRLAVPWKAWRMRFTLVIALTAALIAALIWILVEAGLQL
jgi:hypothetical protein